MTRLPLAALALLLLASCSGKKEGPDNAPHPLSSRDAGFCDRWAEDACNAVVVDECVAQSVDDCVDAQRDFCLREAPEGQYTIDAAQECLDAVEAAYADARLTPTELAVVRGTAAGDPPCADILAGAEGGPSEGDACIVADEGSCGSADLLCVEDALSSATGTCQTPIVRSGGQTCTLPGQICTTGFYCDDDPGTGSGYCIERAGLGNECSLPDQPPDIPCREDLFCDLTTFPHRCAAQQPFGAACSSNMECESGLCQVNPGVCVNDIDLALGDEFGICADLR